MSNPDRERLRTFFGSVKDSAIPKRWDDLWKEGDFLPFDRHSPNPALDEALEKHVSSSDPPSAKHLLGYPKTKWALVPGCGRGYDVLLLKAYGYNAVGLEISETAVEKCKQFEKLIEQGVDLNGQKLSQEQMNVYKIRNEQIGPGTASFVAGDFFNDSPLALPDGTQLPSKWDLVYDYTFLSALPVSLRPKWSSRMRDLVKPNGGRLVCVEFPTYKEPKTGGPPWGLPSVVYEAHLGRPGKELAYDEEGWVILMEDDKRKVQSGEALEEGGMVRLDHWKAAKTHEIGKGTDHIGLWTLAAGS